MEENELRVEMKGISTPASNEAATMQNHVQQAQETCGNASADTTLDTKRLTVAELDLSQFDGHTPGDWLTRDHHSHVEIYVKAGHTETTIAEVEGTPGDVALVRQSPQLLAELKEARARVEQLEAEVNAQEEQIQSLQRSLRIAKSEMQSCNEAFSSLLQIPFYSWQRNWQTVARIVLGLPSDADVETINLALLMREGGSND